MFDDLDETLRQLMIAEMPIKNGEVEISFHQPRREWSARISRPTINLFLYDVRENAVLRQHQWERLPVPNGKNGDAGRPADALAALKRSPLRVDCLYLLTTWAADPEDEHRLLARSMLTLFRFPILPTERLSGGLKSQPFEIPARLANPEKLTNLSDLWGAMDNEIRPSVTYSLTVAMDPWETVIGPVVRTLTLRSGQAAQPEARLPMPPEMRSLERTYIGGTVRTSAGGGPQAGIQVSIRDSGLAAVTDENGHFILGSLSAGRYVLVAQPAEGRPVEKQIQVPFGKDDLDKEQSYDIVLA